MKPAAGRPQKSLDIRVRSGSRRMKRMGLIKTAWKSTKNYTREIVSLTASLLVETSSCQVTLIGQDGTLIRLSASADSPVEIFRDLVTDGIGEITLETATQGEINFDLTFNFALK